MKRPLRVVVVERSVTHVTRLRVAIERAGFEVRHFQADTPESLRDALLTRSPDVLVSGFPLHDLDLETILTVLRQTKVDVPLIVVASHASKATVTAAVECGVDDFIPAADLERLGPAIVRELRKASQRREAARVLTETRESAQAAFDAAGVGTWEFNVATNTARCSATFARLHGASMGDFVGSLDSFLDLIGIADRQRVRQAIGQDTHITEREHLEYQVQWPDGSFHWIAFAGHTFTGADGEVTKACGIATDVSSQKQLEEQLRQARRMEAIGRLSGGIAHDFNNLLTAIIGYSEFALERVADRPDVAADIEEIRKAGDRASALTRQLLAFSRKQTSEARVLNLNQLVGDLEKMLRRVIGEDVTLELALSPSLGWIKADPCQVEQVLLNLVVNARDAMRRGGRLQIAAANVVLGETFVRTHPGMAPGRYVSLSVADNGCGIKSEVLSHVFEPFFTTKAEGKGTGLGLSTVYGIVRQHDGYVTVDSTLGVGTTFTTYWPQVEAPVEAPRPHVSSIHPLIGAETVLLVEDEAEVRELVRKVLSRYGYRVLVARDGTDAMAIEMGHDGPLHLLLTDIVMPGLNGPDLAQRLVKRRPAMGVTYMSGFAHQAGGDFGTVSNHARFLLKPFAAETLATTIRECLDRPKVSQGRPDQAR